MYVCVVECPRLAVDHPQVTCCTMSCKDNTPQLVANLVLPCLAFISRLGDDAAEIKDLL